MADYEAIDCLRFVEGSPAAVGDHDKAAWLELFARYNIVEDPVGSRPHLSGVYDGRSRRRGSGPLARFWDTFIAPNQIRFQVDHDFVEEERTSWTDPWLSLAALDCVETHPTPPPRWIPTASTRWHPLEARVLTNQDKKFQLSLLCCNLQIDLAWLVCVDSSLFFLMACCPSRSEHHCRRLFPLLSCRSRFGDCSQYTT